MRYADYIAGRGPRQEIPTHINRANFSEPEWERAKAWILSKCPPDVKFERTQYVVRFASNAPFVEDTCWWIRGDFEHPSDTDLFVRDPAGTLVSLKQDLQFGNPTEYVPYPPPATHVLPPEPPKPPVPVNGEVVTPGLHMFTDAQDRRWWHRGTVAAPAVGTRVTLEHPELSVTIQAEWAEIRNPFGVTKGWRELK